MKASILFPPAALQRDIFFSRFLPQAIAAYHAGQYTTAAEVEVSGHFGQDLAEELFSLTNDPRRQEEREALYGAGRSLSSGDIVVCEHGAWMCRPVGWLRLEQQAAFAAA